MTQHSIRRLQIVSIFLLHLVQAIPASNTILTPEGALRSLESRQNSCPASAPLSCRAVDPKLPSNFCCPTGTNCISLDSSSTALCCPAGNACNSILTIDCDLTLEDASKHPNGPVFTTRLTESLSKCPGSDKCCPFGYTCGTASDGSAVCRIVANKAITQPASSSNSPASTSTPASRSSGFPTSSKSDTAATSSAVSPASASSIDSTNPQQAKSSTSSNPFPPSVFLAGFFPGMLVGALGVLAWVILTGRHKKSSDNASATSSIYKKKPYISGPVPVDVHNARTEFLRKSKSFFSKRKPTEGTPGLPFDNWKMPTPPEPNNIPDRPMGQQIVAGPTAKPVPENSSYPTVTQYPVTPKRQIYGEVAEPGTETIRVYSPRDMEIPSATVAPLRGMNSRDRSRSPKVGSAFVSPNRMQDAVGQAPKNQASLYPYESAYEPRYETLSPSRYDGGSSQKPSRAENARPETTFTAMLEEINFPDPMSRSRPQVPEIPRQYRR